MGVAAYHSSVNRTDGDLVVVLSRDVLRRAPGICQRNLQGGHGRVVPNRNGVLGALAHLGLARASVLQGDTGKGREAYRDFLTLWKDADPSVPVLIQAKAEYAKLR